MRIQNSIRATCCHALLLLFVVSMLAHADDVNMAQVFVSPNQSGGTGPFSQTVKKPGHIDLAGVAMGPQFGGNVSSGDGSSHVDYGTIRLFDSAFGTLDALSRGTFRDDLLFDGEPLGTLMTVTYKLWVDGALIVDFSGGGAASWSLQAALGGPFNITKGGTKYNAQSPTPGYHGDPLGVFYLAQTTVQSGFAAQLDVELSTSAQAAYDAYLNPGSATANFLNTLAWGGIQSVTVNGQPVNYSLSSTSGTNWNQSFVPATDTPEPASGFLIAAVIAGLWFLRRRRHSDGYSDLDSSRSPVNRP